MEQPLEITDAGAVRYLTLNRPESLNALDGALLDQLPAALEDAAGDESVRVVVLTGRGRAFCAGGDLSLLLEGVGDLASALARQRAAVLLREMPKPTVAAVNGVAAGAGVSLALAADLRIAAEGARFSAGFGAVGLSGDYGISYHLPRLVGAERAARFLFLSETWDAAAALAHGLVGEVVPDGRFAAAVAELAERLARQAAPALARMKANLRAAERRPFGEVLEAEALGMIALAGTADFEEGVAAFRERRSPAFSAPPPPPGT